MALTAHTRLGPYEILAPIGAGGMGEVYKANDTRLDRAVAIKILPAHFAESAERRQRFEREAKAISQLNHPHICTLYDVGEQDGIHYLVMEYIEGETLAERLKKGALPLDKAIEYGIQMADGLAKAHRAGIVHRDLKPANIMLTKLGVKLLDFGLAKPIEPHAAVDGSDAPTRQKNLTEPRTIVGTLQYMAPEQLEGDDVDARTDLFAFGAVLYEMVTGRKAFAGESQASLITAIMSSEPPPPSETSALDRLVAQCLTKDPEERMQSSHDVMLQLQSIGDANTLVRPTVRQRFRLAWLTAAIVLTAVVTGLLVSNLGRTQALPERDPTRFAIELSSIGPSTSASPCRRAERVSCTSALATEFGDCFSVAGMRSKRSLFRARRKRDYLFSRRTALGSASLPTNNSRRYGSSEVRPSSCAMHPFRNVGVGRPTEPSFSQARTRSCKASRRQGAFRRR